MSNINEQTCKWMQINGGEIVEFKDTITNPNPGSPVTVKFYLEEPLTSLEREWEFNDQITSIDLSKMNADDLSSMKRTFYGTEKLEKVILPNSAKLDVENLDVEQIIGENGYKNVKWSGNSELSSKIYEELNYTPEEPEEPEKPTYEEVKYEIVDNDEENWKQGEVHKLTVARISGTVEDSTLTLTITGGSVKPTTIVDNKAELSQEIEVTPESDSIKIILSVSDSELCSFVKNEIPEADEEDEPSVDPENPSDDPSEEEKEPAKYELVSEDNNEWTQETEYSLTFRRVSGDVETPNKFTIEAEGVSLDKYSLTDNGDEEYEETIIAIPTAETLKVEVKLEDEVVASFEKSDVKPTETPEQPEEKTPEEKLEEALEQGGEVEVNEPINIIEPLTISKPDTLLVLNNTIKSEKTALVITGDTVLTGEGNVEGGEGGDYSAVVIKNGASVTIEGGNYSVGADAKGEGNSCIYLVDGTLKITGGHFETATQWDGRYWVINKLNDSEGTISIKGGEFVGFNPANPQTDDDETYVAEGYEAIEHEGVWTVSRKEEEEVEPDPTEPEEKPNLSEGVEGEYEMTESESINKSISINEGTLNLGENTLTIANEDAEYNDQIITVSGLSTISGGTIDAKEYQGEAVLFKLEPEASLTVEKTHISANTTMFSAPDSSQVRVTYAYCYCFGPGYLFYSDGGKFVIESGVFSSETNTIFKVSDEKAEDAENAKDLFLVQGGEFVGFNPKNAGAINEKWEEQSLLDEGLDVEENENVYKVVSKSDEEEEEETPDPSTDPSDEENQPSDNPSEEEDGDEDEDPSENPSNEEDDDEDPSEDPSNEETEPSEEEDDEEDEDPSEDPSEEETPSEEEEEDEPSTEPTPEE